MTRRNNPEIDITGRLDLAARRAGPAANANTYRADRLGILSDDQPEGADDNAATQPGLAPHETSQLGGDQWQPAEASPRQGGAIASLLDATRSAAARWAGAYAGLDSRRRLAVVALAAAVLVVGVLVVAARRSGPEMARAEIPAPAAVDVVAETPAGQLPEADAADTETVAANAEPADAGADPATQAVDETDPTSESAGVGGSSPVDQPVTDKPTVSKPPAASDPATAGGAHPPQPTDQQDTAESAPTGPPPPPRLTVAPAGFHLVGIIEGPAGRLANINGSFVRNGDTILGATVIEVGVDSVELERNGARFVIGQ